jgi:hypothetical protein
MTPDPRLVELVEAAQNLVQTGGTVANRTRLKKAVEAIPAELMEMPAPPRGLRLTPPVEQAIARAAELANASNDLYLRTHHLEFALAEIQGGTQQPPTHQPQ